MKPRNFSERCKLFFFPILENKKQTLYMVIHFIINALSGVIFVFFIREIVQILEAGEQDVFYQTILVFSIIFILQQSLLFSCNKLGWPVTFNRYSESIENKYMRKYVRFDNNVYERVGTGKSIAIISRGIKTWSGLIDKLIIEVIHLGISLALTFYFVSLIDSRLIFLLLGLLIFGQGMGLYLNSFVVEERKNRIEFDNLAGKQLVKIIMSKMEVLQSGKISQEIEKVKYFHENQILCNKRLAPYLILFFMVSYVTVFMLLLIVFIYFGNLYFTGSIELSLLVGLSGAIILMQKDFSSSLDFLKNFTKEFAEVQNMWDFFDTTPQIEGYETGKTFKHKDGQISLQNISYGYDVSKSVFTNFSLDIPGNKITAFVGPSGGGKSTLVKLIAGYIRQDRGNVLVDNQNLSEVSLKSYYKDIGYLTQEPSVFDGTVKENLLYAVGEDILEKKIKKIIKLAHCEFIYDLPAGLSTEIGERGVKLSGGQKQRLAIAKIFLKDPKIIILDEPTSALDSLSEQKITQAMHNLFAGRTVIIIAHRLQTVKHADDIIVIEAGKVIERGTHASLIRKKGYYKQMLDLQSGF